VPQKVLDGYWKRGWVEVRKPRKGKRKRTAAGYITRELRNDGFKKMEPWPDLCLAFLWAGGCRMSGLSRGFPASPKTKSKWQLWDVAMGDTEELEKDLELFGFFVRRPRRRRRCQNSPQGESAGRGGHRWVTIGRPK